MFCISDCQSSTLDHTFCITRRAFFIAYRDSSQSLSFKSGKEVVSAFLRASLSSTLNLPHPGRSFCPMMGSLFADGIATMISQSFFLERLSLRQKTRFKQALRAHCSAHHFQFRTIFSNSIIDGGFFTNYKTWKTARSEVTYMIRLHR